MLYRITGWWLLLCLLVVPLALAPSAQAAAQVTPPQISSTAVIRASILQRAQAWVSLSIPYSQTRFYPTAAGYRTDCSGFVSMAYQLPTEIANGTHLGGPTTSMLPQYFHQITKAELLPGDILLLPPPSKGEEGHVVIFAGWTSAAKNRYIGLEEVRGKISGKRVAQAVQRSIAYPYDRKSAHSADYIPMRYNGFGAQLTGQISQLSPVPANFTTIAMTSGPDGNLWFTGLALSPDQSQLDQSLIGCLTPRGSICLTPKGARKEYLLPTGNEFLTGITTGSDGNLWFTESIDYNGDSIGQIGRITPQGQLSEFAIPIANSDPVTITNGADGNLWFTDTGTHEIGRISPGRNPQSSIVEFSVPQPTSATGGVSLLGITSGSDGNIWFTQTTFDGTATVGQIGRIITLGSNPASGIQRFSIQMFRIPSGKSLPAMITSGPDGNLWFTESTETTVDSGGLHTIGQIGRITPQGQISEFPIPNSDFHTQGGGGFLYGIQSGPLAIATGPDGNLWFTNNDIAHQNLLGRITPDGKSIQFPFAQAHGSYAVVSSSDSNLWFTGFDTSQTNQLGLLQQIAFRH